MASTITANSPSPRLYSAYAQNQNRVATGARVNAGLQPPSADPMDSKIAAFTAPIESLARDSRAAAQEASQKALEQAKTIAGVWEAADKEITKAAENNDLATVKKLRDAAQDTVNGLLSQRGGNVETDFLSSHASKYDVDIPAELANQQKSQALVDVGIQLSQLKTPSRLADMVRAAYR